MAHLELKQVSEDGGHHRLGGGQRATQSKDLGRLSETAEAGSDKAIADKRGEVWKPENAEAIAGYNADLETNGLPLKELRMFDRMSVDATP